jgi:hypothetical protein
MTVFTMAQRWKPHLQPIVSAKIPPSTKPIEKPIGWPPPIEAKAMFLLLPSGKVLVIMLTADGRQNEMATPANPRKTISSVPVCDKPHARVNADWSTHPVKYIGLEPTTSDTEPRRRSVQPQVRA